MANFQEYISGEGKEELEEVRREYQEEKLREDKEDS